MSFNQTNGFGLIRNKPFELPIIKQPTVENDYSDDNEEKLKIITKKNRKETYGKGIEAKVIREELGDFNVYKSPVYQAIIHKYGRSIRFSELLGIVNTIQIYLKYKHNIVLPQISRNEKRSFPLLIKYIDRNSEIIMPWIDRMTLCDSNLQKISLDTK